MTESRGKETSVAEQRIALALIVEVQNKAEPKVEYRFNDGKNIFVVNVRRAAIEPNEYIGTYVSLGPPGEKCECCDGSGKRLKVQEETKLSADYKGAGG
ncbi:MAG: hypothetical protein AB1508_16540 [Pseudomonadota bacterium]